MERPTHPPGLENRRYNAQICEQACEWFVEFRAGEPDEAARKAFHAWLQESPQHMGAYLQVTAIWNESASLDPEEKWTLDALIAQAAADPDNVVPFTSSDPLATLEEPSYASGAVSRSPFPHRSTAKRNSAPGVRLFLAASLLLAVAGVSAWFITQRHTYFTATGEQRSIALPDGSTVNLNSRSRIRVRYSDHERAVDLQEGQALFEVAKNPDRPFIVTSGDTRVRAVGTQFDVYRKKSGTVVTVIEGRVAVLGEAASFPPAHAARRETLPLESEVSPLTANGKERISGNVKEEVSGGAMEAAAGKGKVSPIFLSAGEQLRVASNIIPHPISVDIARATSWTQRQLVFESAPLAEVAEEFNRYNTRQLVIRDAALNTFQIDGVFSSTDPASLIRFLRARPGVRVTVTDSEIDIASR